MTSTPINELNDRAQDIFRVVVEAYLESGAPVGSRTISKISSRPIGSLLTWVSAGIGRILTALRMPARLP